MVPMFTVPRSTKPKFPSKYFRLLRVKDWIKNVLVFAPLVFAGEWTHLSSVMLASIAFLMFCLAAAAVYCINDIHDVFEDRSHPKKRHSRPLATGELSIATVLGLAVFLFLAMVLMSWLVLPVVLPLLLSYVGLMLAYTYYLKRQPILDIFTIASGFVIRVYAGAVAIHVPVSAWMFITTLALALYLAAIKRRQEVLRSGDRARAVLKYYSESLITRYAEMSGGAALVFYSLFVITEKQQMVLTIPIVLFALFRYWYVVEARDLGESPTDVFTSDPQLILAIIAWIGITGYVI